jgi:WD40 repeat protein
MKRLTVILASAVLCSGLAFWWTKAGGVRGEPARRSSISIAESLAATAMPTAPPRSLLTDTAARTQLFFDPVVISPCTLVPVHEQEVSSQVDGALQEILVNLGDEVRPGQLLARLDDSALRPQLDLLRLKAESDSAVRIARAQYEEAQLKVTYAEKANAGGGRSVPPLEYKTYLQQQQRFKHEVTRAEEERRTACKEFEKAQRLQQQHEIRSSIHGRVLKVHKRNGEAVKQAEPLFRIANAQRLRVEGLCKVQQGNLLKTGMPALLEPEVRGEQLTELAGHTETVTAVAVSPAGSLLASASEDRTAIVWDWASGKRLATLSHPAEVYALAFAPASPAGQVRLLTGCADGQVRLWDISMGASGSLQPFTPAAGAAIRTLALSPDGRWCATGGEDKKIALWDVAAGTHLRWIAAEDGLPAHQGAVTWLQFTPDGCLISAGRDNTLKIWRLGTDAGQLVSLQAGRTGEIGQLGLSPDGQQLLFDHGDELRILDRASWSALGSLRSRRQGRFHGLALFSPTGRLLLTGSSNNRLQLWKAPAAPEQVAFFRSGYGAGLERRALAALLPLGSVLAAEEHLPRLWDVGARELHHFVLPGAAAARCGAFAPDETVVFTGGTDKVIHVWALPARAEWGRPLEAHITFVGNQIERGTDTIRVRAEIDNPQDFPLMPGGHASLKLYPETAAFSRVRVSNER